MTIFLQQPCPNKILQNTEIIVSFGLYTFNFTVYVHCTENVRTIEPYTLDSIDIGFNL